MIYDYIIAGAGISGSVCAYMLSKNGASCIILEKNKRLMEKICGGGVPRKAIDLLDKIGIDTKLFLSKDVSIINGHVVEQNGMTKRVYYSKEKFALGMKRRILDGYILEQALLKGCKIDFGINVSKIIYKDSLYKINGYLGRNFICAVGARGIGNNVPKGQSMGISAQIYGRCILSSNKFYYWYYTESDDRYYWMFPIGKDLWNIGVWYRKPYSTLLWDYKQMCFYKIKKYFPFGYQIVSQPKGEFLGNVDQRLIYKNNFYGIGDFAGMNNIKNGGGILPAIKSAIILANNF